MSLLNKTNKGLSQHFDVKNLEDASFILGIEIHYDKSHDLLGLSQKSYVERVLKRFNITSCFHSPKSIQKGEVISKA